MQIIDIKNTKKTALIHFYLANFNNIHKMLQPVLAEIKSPKRILIYDQSLVK